jgi:hypothetical protein
VFEVLISKVLPNRDRKGVGMGLRLTKGDEDAPVTHAPSNVKDAAASKSFIFINIVARSAVMGTLLRAANTRDGVST